MSGAEDQPKTEDQRNIHETERGSIEITNVEAAQKFIDAANDIQRFQLKTSLDLYDRMTHQFDNGTSTYEKMILLGGGIIVLSISFLGSLSSRFANGHITGKPHLWLVVASWIFLIGSMYFSYRVIIDRHAASTRLLVDVSSRQHKYISERLGSILSGIGTVTKGEINIGAERVQIPQMFETLQAALKQESEATVQKMQDYITNGRKTDKEPVFARLAVSFMLLGILTLCIFTILSVNLLF